ncbi:hypothetical protein NHX12_026582 [Muraenolepis orangiensis]|uniref:Transmembrane protein 18 n=1 Tax=Muraenolepis orangiensis TaxID=630683 RepID=A0A9Q0EMK3_9TELE|nr:hypothetical protein NHX12_026582 [Muraenolepis orangiensis]
MDISYVGPVVRAVAYRAADLPCGVSRTDRVNVSVLQGAGRPVPAHGSFSNFQYFDSSGMFISLVYSIPLLFNTIIIVMVWVYRTFSTMTELKIMQLKRRALRDERKKIE